MGVDLVQWAQVSLNSISSASLVFSSAVSSGNAIVTMFQYINPTTLTFSTVTDNVNNAGFVQRINSTLSVSTAAHILIYDKLNISSGAAASTYRMSFNFSGSVSNARLGIGEFNGGTYTFGSTGSSQGASSSPQGPILTASTTPLLLIGLFESAASAIRSTMGGQGILLGSMDEGASGALAYGYSTGSSLTQRMTFRIANSTTWDAGEVLYTVVPPAVVDTPSPWTMGLMGFQ